MFIGDSGAAAVNSDTLSGGFFDDWDASDFTPLVKQKGGGG